MLDHAALTIGMAVNKDEWVVDPVEGEPPDGPTVHRGDFELLSPIHVAFKASKKKLDLPEVTLHRRKDPCGQSNCRRCASDV